MNDEQGLTASPVQDEPRTLSRLNAPVFRTVTTSSGRKALRLEQDFWTALDSIALERGVSKNTLIDEIANGRGKDDSNLASHVRSYVARYLYDRNLEYARRYTLQPLIELLQQAPVPSFAMSREKRLLKVNREFLRLLQIVAGDPKTTIALETIQLTIDTPLVDIIASIEQDARPHQCGVTISVGHHVRKAVTRVIGLPGHPVPAVVGYIIS